MDQKLKEIKHQISKMPITNANTFFARKEIKSLPDILMENEKLENIIVGNFSSGTGVLICTNVRLMFVNKGFFFGLKVIDFPLKNISSIEYSTGMILGKIKIHMSGNTSQIEYCDKKSVSSFVNYVRSKL